MYETTLKDNICHVKMFKVISPIFVRKRPIKLSILIFWPKLKIDHDPIVATLKYGIISIYVIVEIAVCQNNNNINNTVHTILTKRTLL